jgi:uncharacterized protein YbjT (DUF2867 family)
MICVTGAGGTVGSEVVKQLDSAKAPFRAAYFSKEKAEAARARAARRRSATSMCVTSPRWR